MDQTIQAPGQGPIQRISVDEEWPWPMFPRKAQRNYTRGAGEQLVGWEGDFLDTYKDSGIVRIACEGARIAQTTVSRRRVSDPEFDVAFREAKLMAVDALEAIAWQRAVHGRELSPKRYFHNGKQIMTMVNGREVPLIDQETEISNDLLKFLLRANNPKKFGQVIDHKHTLQVDQAASEARRRAEERGLDPDKIERVEAMTRKLMGEDD